MSDFGINLKHLRKTILELTQEQMAEKIKISPTQYKNYEQGRSFPSIDKLSEICKIFDIPADYLLRDKDRLFRDCATVELYQELKNMDDDKSEALFCAFHKLYEYKKQSKDT